MRVNRAFGIDFYLGDKTELLTSILSNSMASFSYVVTPNVNHVVQINHSPELRAAYADASFRVCDSKVLQPILSFFSVNLKEAIPGSDLTKDLFERANELKMRVTVIGSTCEEMEILGEKFPNIIIQHHSPPFGFIDSPRLVENCLDFISEKPADLIFFAVGCPRQEILAHLVFQKGGAVGVGLCVGASILFLSGKVARAPVWLQNLKLEWLHRIMSEPRRLASRYIVDAYKLVPIILNEKRKRK